MKILIIGLTISDINFSQIISDKILYMPSEYKSIEILPTTFDEKKWITETSLPCWYCKNKIFETPIPIPIGFDGEIKVKGICCNYLCARRYILFYRDPDIDEKELNIHLDLLNLVCKKLKIDDFKDIPHVCHFYEEGGFGI